MRLACAKPPLRAGWNTLLKLKLEPMVATASVASGAVVAPLAALMGLPNAAAWPHILGSLAIHIVYYLALAQAHRSGDLSQVYPSARGTAPLLTAMGTTLW